MDYDQKDDYSSPLPLEPSPAPPAPRRPGYHPPQGAPRRRRSGWSTFLLIVLVLSILGNIVLFFMVGGLAAMSLTGYSGMLTEVVIRDSSAREKIAVISLVGIIYGGVSQDIYEQLQAAGADANVKGVILRVYSPGGTVSGSDRIYNDIRKFRKESGIPVIAFMEGVAASGGYYASVACEKIIAEPTTVTGSIGVVAKYYVFEELLESKLGVKAITVKSGRRKDWPSSTRIPDAEELKYIEDKIITPAYERFLSVIIEGRKGVLSADEIKRLADGSIFMAPEAKKEKLIDAIGYLDDAIALCKSMAGLRDAKVVEYRKPLSLFNMLGVQKSNALKFDKSTLYEFGTMERMYLWEAY